MLLELFYFPHCVCLNALLSFPQGIAKDAVKKSTFLISVTTTPTSVWLTSIRSRTFGALRLLKARTQSHLPIVYMFVRLVCSARLSSGEEEWFQEVFADENKMYEVLKSYRAHRKLVLAGQAKTKQFVIMDQKQKFSKNTSVDVFGEGELLNRRWFVTWASAFFFIAMRPITTLLCISESQQNRIIF